MSVEAPSVSEQREQLRALEEELEKKLEDAAGVGSSDDSDAMDADDVAELQIIA